MDSNDNARHIRCQKSWLCVGPNCIKEFLNTMKGNCPPEPTTEKGLKEEQLLKDLEATILNLEDFYNENENR